LIITVGAGGAATKLTVPEDGVGPPLPGSWDSGGRGGGALAVVTTEGTAVVLTSGEALVKGVLFIRPWLGPTVHCLLHGFIDTHLLIYSLMVQYCSK